MEIDPDDAFAWPSRGHIQGFLNKQPEIAVGAVRPRDPAQRELRIRLGHERIHLLLPREPDEALERLRNAWRLSPFDPLNFFSCTVAGIAEFVAGRYEQAVGWLRKAQP